MTGSKKDSIFVLISQFEIKDEITIKGNSDGTNVLIVRAKPFLKPLASALDEANVKIMKVLTNKTV